jgi:hypothetical protein
MISGHGQLYIKKDGKYELISFAEEVKFSLEPFIGEAENVIRNMRTIVGTFEKVHINTKEPRKAYNGNNKSKKRYVNIGRAEKLMRRGRRGKRHHYSIRDRCAYRLHCI